MFNSGTSSNPVAESGKTVATEAQRSQRFTRYIKRKDAKAPGSGRSLLPSIRRRFCGEHLKVYLISNEITKLIFAAKAVPAGNHKNLCVLCASVASD
jgi:hypothetical protein